MPPSPPQNRLVVPSAFVLVGALAFSLVAHMQAYEGLGDLRAWFLSSAQDSMPSSTIEITLGDPPETPTPHDELDPVAEVPSPPAHERPREHRREHPRERERPPQPRPEVVTPPPPAPPPPAPTAPSEPTPPAPPPDHTRPSVAQHSLNPDQPPPEDAQYQADENNTVAEETMAQITSATHDDAIPNPGPTDQASTQQTPGESDATVVADMRDTDGTDERRPTPDEAEQDDPPDATDRPAHAQRPTEARTGTDGSDAPGAPEHGTPATGDESGVLALGGRETQEVMISDGFGSYSVRVVAPGAAGDGGGTRGGHRRTGTGLGTRGHGVYVGSVGDEGGSPHDHGVGERDGPRVGITYATAEAVYGEDQLEHERHMRLERRRSHTRGSTSAAIWEHFRAASENYIAGVRPGNQTALNAAASPFARFLHDMHVRIHQEFAEHYLSTLSLDPADPLNDENLYTVLEIAVNPDGTIFQVGIVRTSGQTLYDLGAFTAVWRAQPYPRPPTIIMSGDGHAWLHWRFDRGPNHCGTWNAEPFLLDNGDTAPATTSDAVRDEDLHDEPTGAGEGIEMVPAAPVGAPSQ